MKKSLIALAALATVATAAQAQSSVTLYGIVDVGVLNAKGVNAADQSITSVVSGALSTSRWGVRGTEDLGGGLSASFVLESQIAADTGVGGGTTTMSGTSTNSLFNRAANVALTSASLGTVTLGRMNRIDYDAIVSQDAFAGNNFGGATNVTYLGANIDGNEARISNAVKYTSPSISGLVVSYQHGFGEVAGDTKKYQQSVVGADYTFQNLKLTATYGEEKSSTGAKLEDRTQYLGSYNFGVLKAFAGYMERKVANDADKTKATYVGAIIPVNANVNVLANYSNIKKVNVTADDANVFAVGVTYGFSKRTTAYAMYGQSSNDGAATVGATSLATTGAGKDQKATVVGIRHTF